VRRARDVVDGTGAFPAERLAALAFSQLDHLRRRAHEILTPNRRRTIEFLRSRAEFEFVEPQGGTVVFPRLRAADTADALADWLLTRESTAIVPGRFFEAPSHCRIGFGVRPDVLEGGLAAIARALDQRRL
jgi:aspartate/methionine/tyrosine aminotransferase